MVKKLAEANIAIGPIVAQVINRSISIEAFKMKNSRVDQETL
jgi:hypothetical protein